MATGPVKLYDILMRIKIKAACTLEEAVLKMLGSATKSKARKLIKNSRVSVEGRAELKPSVLLSPGQSVEISRAETGRAERGGRTTVRKRLPFQVLFEDEYLIVVDKPAGILSIATDKERSRTLYRMVSDYVKASTDGEKKIFIVHRLDRDVSGAMVLAKDEKTKRRMQDEWASAEKIYSAVLDGHPSEKEGTVEGWLCENKAHRVYSCDSTTPGAEKALTHYRVVKPGRPRSVVEVRLETGRKHQIRVHMASMGCPVAGDRLYGTPVKGMSGIGLHALSLSFNHPHTGKRVTVKSPLPGRLRELLTAPR